MGAFGSSKTVKPCVIDAGESISDGINLGDQSLYGIVIPDAWTAANLTFQASVDSGLTWHDVKDATGDEVVVTASTAGDYITLIPDALKAVTDVKVRSGISGTAVNQVATATIALVLFN